MLSGNKQLCTGCPGLKEALVRHFGEVEMQSNLTFYMLKSDCTLLVATSSRFLSRYTFLPGVAHQAQGRSGRVCRFAATRYTRGYSL